MNTPRRSNQRLAELRRLRDQVDDAIAREEVRCGLSRARPAEDANRFIGVVLGVVEAVAHYHGVTVDDIKGRGRSRSVCSARQVAMWLLHARGASYVELARLFDRDRSTVMHDVRAAERDPGTAAAIRAVERVLRERTEATA